MLAAGNTKISDLLCVTTAPIPKGAHAMTQLVELPPADLGIRARIDIRDRYSVTYSQGRMLFELEGDEPARDRCG